MGRWAVQRSIQGGQFVERGVAASTNVRHVFGKGGGHLQDPDTGMADESARHLEQPSTHDGDHPAADGEGPAGLFAVIEEIGLIAGRISGSTCSVAV